MISFLASLRARARRFRADRAGVVAVEYALGVPMLLIVLSGAVDLGLALHQSSALGNAARAGAQYALRFPSDTAGIKEIVEKSLTYDSGSLTVSSKLACECPDKNAVVCTETCAGATPQAYVSVAVTKTYSSPLPTAYMLGISTVSGSATLRSN